MSERRRMFLLILIMLSVSLAVTGITIHILYQTAIDEQKERLSVTAKSQARLIEAIARYDAVYSRDYPKGPVAATLSQVIDAHKNYKGFGRTGEFTLARREEDHIVFLLSHRHFDLDNPRPIKFDSTLAEPMRRALSGDSGVLTGLDYRGMTVLAAYEPVAVLNFGIVAKIDLAEIREPFIKAIRITGILGLLIVLSGAGLFLRISNPIIKRLKEEKEFSESMLSAMVDTVFVFDPETGRPFRWNHSLNEISGYNDEEIAAGKVPDDWFNLKDQMHLKQMIEKVHKEGQATVELSLKTSNGSLIPMEYIASFVKNTRYIIAIGRDISNRKQTEKELQKAHDELEDRVLERTEEVRSLSYRLLQVQEEERKRFAHDLHDSIGQTLIAIKMQMEIMISNLSQNAPGLRKLKNILAIVQEAIHEVRSITANLRPPAIDNLGLLAAMSSLCDHFAKDTRIHIQKKYDLKEVDVPESLRIVIYRILKEALSNVFKHSQADQVLVFLNKNDEAIELAVEDNGLGFDLNSSVSTLELEKGIGLSSMRERTNLSCGTFYINSEKGKGTKIRAVWPLML